MNYRSSLAKMLAFATLLVVSRASSQDTKPAAQSPDRSSGKSHAMKQKWVFTTGGDVSATPTIGNDALYFPDWGGNLFAVRKGDGQVIWSHKISEYDGVFGSVSRVSPALHGDDLILGDIESGNLPHNGANMMAVDRHTGALKWKTQVDTNPAAIITGSAVVLGDVAYVGVSSNEEALASSNSYKCCSFRGSVVAMNANSGAILWKTFVVPGPDSQTPSYSGGAIWQLPAIDTARGSLYVGTGNNYSVPDSVKACQAASNPTGNSCLAADDFFDSALSLDLKTGAVKWAKRLQGFDVWTVACISQPVGVNCPSPSSPDYDLGGSGPNLLPTMVGFGQKSGMYWALDPDTGKIKWSTVVGPGGTLGGIEWGTATDGSRIYVAIANGGHEPYRLRPSGVTTTGGAWSALDVSTGEVLWQTADPMGAIDTGAVTVANGSVYAGSYSGHMYTLNAKTGQITFDFDSKGSVIDAPAIVDGVVYWGSGYKKISPGIGNNQVFAFEARGDDRR